MNIITISREFASGGRELGKRLADALGYDYYDREIISALAKKAELDEGYVEAVLQNQSFSNFDFSFSNSFTNMDVMTTNKIQLLVKQQEVIEQIAQVNRNCIIVGRNADMILKQYKPLSLFVCASKEAKIKRCKEKAKEYEVVSEKDMLKKMKQIDKNRIKTRILMGGEFGNKYEFHFCINSGDIEMKKLVKMVKVMAENYFDNK